MLSLNATQLAIVASLGKKIAYLFDIDLTGDGTIDYYYGFEARTWNTHSYVFKIIGFDPITLSKGAPESGILTPSTTTIQITNKDNTLVPSTFESATITVRCVMRDSAEAYTESEIMAWTFKVKSASSIFQTISLECEDWFAGYLRGDYPKTRLVSDLFPYPASKHDNVCVPLAFGTPFFPLRWIPKNLDALYISSTIFEVSGDQTALFSAGQYLWAHCGVDGVKGCWVDSSATNNNCIQIARTTIANPTARQTLSLEIGATYRVSALSKKGDINTIALQLGATNIAYTAPDDWNSTPHTLTHVAAGTTEYLYLFVVTNTGTNYAYFDSVKVQKVNADGSFGPNLVTNGHFNSDIVEWTAINGANLAHCSGIGSSSTKVTLTVASDDLTVNLATVQTDHYLLGTSEMTYTIAEARTPKDFGSKTIFLPAAYTFKQDIVTGSDEQAYKAVQVFLPNGSNIYFKPPECMDVPFLFSRSDLVAKTNLANIVDYILQDWVIPSARIDASSVTAAAAIYTTNGLVLNVGLYFQQNREKLICKLMALGGLVLLVRDKIYFKVLTKVSQKTLTKTDILPGTFSLQRKVYTQDEKDSAYLLWQVSGEPQDQANKSLISLKSGNVKPADDVIEAEWVSSSGNAKKAAKLALQKKILPIKEITFKSNMCLSALEPGDMITINDADLGGTYPAMIDKITYDQKCNLSFSCTVFSDTLDDWSDLSESDITIYATDDSKGYSGVIQGPTDSTGNGPNQITGTVLIGTDGQFKTSIDPATTGGMIMTNQSLTGYNTAGAIRFQAIYAGADQGDVTIGNYAGGKGIWWDQSVGECYVRGTLNADDITTGVLTARTMQTKGAKLTQATSAGATTVYLNDTTDFPSSGTGYIYDTNVNSFLYTGKTSTTLTGCSGVLDHATGLAIGGKFKRMIVSALDNEMHFYGDHGGGVVSELISLGIKTEGSDTMIGVFGNTDSSHIALYGRSKNNFAVAGLSVDGIGMIASSSNNMAILADSTNGYGGQFNGPLAPIILGPSLSASAPTHSATKGSLWVTSAGVLYINTSGSTTWAKVGSQ